MGGARCGCVAVNATLDEVRDAGGTPTADDDGIVRVVRVMGMEAMKPPRLRLDNPPPDKALNGAPLATPCAAGQRADSLVAFRHWVYKIGGNDVVPWCCDVRNAQFRRGGGWRRAVERRPRGPHGDRRVEDGDGAAPVPTATASFAPCRGGGSGAAAAWR
ncbi:MAG: hypothetical protein HY905_00330 [Deltaproteobacteria bacterium]|nr:hypothetical protein [Deltaproteobacteria bacterium]